MSNCSRWLLSRTISSEISLRSAKMPTSRIDVGRLDPHADFGQQLVQLVGQPARDRLRPPAVRGPRSCVSSAAIARALAARSAAIERPSSIRILAKWASALVHDAFDLRPLGLRSLRYSAVGSCTTPGNASSGASCAASRLTRVAERRFELLQDSPSAPPDSGDSLRAAARGRSAH